jgi:hypothetical protein
LPPLRPPFAVKIFRRRPPRSNQTREEFSAASPTPGTSWDLQGPPTGPDPGHPQLVFNPPRVIGLTCVADCTHAADRLTGQKPWLRPRERPLNAHGQLRQANAPTSPMPSRMAREAQGRTSDHRIGMTSATETSTPAASARAPEASGSHGSFPLLFFQCAAEAVRISPSWSILKLMHLSINAAGCMHRSGQRSLA